MLTSLPNIGLPGWTAIGAFVGSPSVLGRPDSWQYAMLVPIPVAVLFMLTGLAFPESPKHLYQTLGREDDARRAAKFYMGTDDVWPDLKLEYDKEMRLRRVRDKKELID
ncbi:MAG: MFS transporter [Pseudoalteromonas sp.]|nr:MFS transporter [Pseudoalteromonas sp.]